MLDLIRTALSKFRYRFNDERELHEGIKLALDVAGLPYQHEFIASAQDRLDFLVDDHWIIEAKIKGTQTAAIRQAGRYAHLPMVHGILIATTKAWAVGSLNGLAVPVHVVKLERQAF